MELEIKNLSGGYRKHPVLEDLSLTLKPGTITVLLGANGSGKSTLLKMINRTLRPTAGRVLIGGTDVEKWPRRQLAQQLALLSQNHHSPDELTVGELAALGCFPHNRNAFGILSAAEREIVAEAMRATGILHLKDRRLSELSGGEEQRAWLAMAVAQHPEIMLLDEPTTFLDISSQFSFMELLRKLNREHQMTIVAVLHDLNLAAALADDIVLLKERKIFAAGKANEVLTPENIKAVFGIPAEVITLRSGRIHCII